MKNTRTVRTSIEVAKRAKNASINVHGHIRTARKLETNRRQVKYDGHKQQPGEYNTKQQFKRIKSATTAAKKPI